jgi:hypothetical protein
VARYSPGEDAELAAAGAELQPATGDGQQHFNRISLCIMIKAESSIPCASFSLFS